MGCWSTPTFGHAHISDLAELVHSSMHVSPGSGDFDVGFVHELAVAHGVAAGSGDVGEEGSEAWYPSLDGDMIGPVAALS